MVGHPVLNQVVLRKELMKKNRHLFQVIRQKEMVNHAKQQTKLTASSGHNIKEGYGQFRVILKSLLTRSVAIELATWFGYSPADIDKIKNSDSPSGVFVELMDQRGEISPTDISKLHEGLSINAVGFVGVAGKVKEAFTNYRTKLPSTNGSQYAGTMKVVDEKETYHYWKEWAVIYTRLIKTGLLSQTMNPIIDNNTLMSIATKLTKEWKDVGRNLHLLEEELYHVEVDNVGNIKETLYKMLLKWKQKRDSQATTEVLDINEERDMKWKIQDMFVNIGVPCLDQRKDSSDEDSWYPLDSYAELLMYQLDLFVVLFLRQMKVQMSIFEAVKTFLLPKDLPLNESDIKSILNGKSTIVLALDGLDKYAGRDDQEFECSDVMEWFGACHLSRPCEEQVDFHIKLKDIDPKELHYLFRFVCGLNPQSANGILQYLLSVKSFAIFCLCFNEYKGEWNFDSERD
ncbi:hypothetical protein HOLleu_25013 [Holothuria leucospilota]|uniref:Death domain-containing protein n=1 Tax=Holothuria leucospilota TaxID=206669 RepID=A0A9Q1H427_HOLLE|nr:hypothetical protein HOLleu_25013 [Holothuria leucospilota]